MIFLAVLVASTMSVKSQTNNCRTIQGTVTAIVKDTVFIGAEKIVAGYNKTLMDTVFVGKYASFTGVFGNVTKVKNNYVYVEENRFRISPKALKEFPVTVGQYISFIEVGEDGKTTASIKNIINK